MGSAPDSPLRPGSVSKGLLLLAICGIGLPVVWQCMKRLRRPDPYPMPEIGDVPELLPAEEGSGPK